MIITGIIWTYRNRGFRASTSDNSAWIPGPMGVPLKGNVQELQTKGAASCKAWYSLYRRYGPAYEMTIPFFRLHVINHLLISNTFRSIIVRTIYAVHSPVMFLMGFTGLVFSLLMAMSGDSSAKLLLVLSVNGTLRRILQSLSTTGSIF